MFRWRAFPRRSPACGIAKLVDAGRFRFGSKLATLLRRDFLDKPPADSRAPNITIGQLLTHSSGIPSDPSQGGPVLALPLDQTNLKKQMEITFSYGMGANPGASYRYNNMNYAVLGRIIEIFTREPYEAYCGRQALTPLGITAMLNPPWRVMSSWGGWKISAVDYAKFLAYLDPSRGFLTTGPATWPKFDLGGGKYYSLGTLQRTASSGGYNLWHSGSWQWHSPPSSFGSFYAMLGSGVRYATNFEPTVTSSALGALDAALYNAAVGSTARMAPAAPGGVSPEILYPR